VSRKNGLVPGVLQAILRRIQPDGRMNFLPTPTVTTGEPAPTWSASPLHWATNLAVLVTFEKTVKCPLEETVALRKSQRLLLPSRLDMTTVSPPWAGVSVPMIEMTPGLPGRRRWTVSESA